MAFCHKGLRAFFLYKKGRRSGKSRFFIRFMKILFINGSPRGQGNISRMLCLMESEAKRFGAETYSIRGANIHVHPCTGCMRCRATSACVLPEDDAQRTLTLLHEADAVVIGAPCYWGNIPGQLKVLFDRMVYGMMGESPRGIPQPLHKGKKAVLVSACTTPWPFNVWFNQSRGAIKALREILKWSGFRITSVIEKSGTKRRPALTDRDEEKCRKAIRRLLC